MLWNYIGLSLIVACLTSLVEAAPHRSKSSKKSTPHTVFDQKQHGDYNIQVHLKDFQIIALMSDDLGGLGDYDYNYDYSDFTVKPVSNSTTSSPTTTTNYSPSTTPKLPSSSAASISISPSSPLSSSSILPSVSSISTSNLSPGISPTPTSSASPLSSITTSVSSPLLQVSSTTTSSEKSPSLIHDNPSSIQTPIEQSAQNQSVGNPSSVVISDSQPLLLFSSSNTSLDSSKLSNDTSLEAFQILTNATAIQEKPLQTLTNTTAIQEKPLPASSAAPDKIKVQIIGVPQTQGASSVIPGEELNGAKPGSIVVAQQADNVGHGAPQGGHLTQKERRCLTGFTRDKWGRCRRVRRPGGGGSSQIPFDINRLASLATRFRFGATETAPHLTAED